MQTAISIKNLSKTYSNGFQAIKDINLDIPQGGFFALLGANGAGKTTIIGILTDLVRKTEGTVKVFNYDIDKNMNDAKRCIGVVPQEFNFNIFEKVINIVVDQAGYYGIPRNEAIPRAMEVLEQLGLKDKAEEQSKNLSGGMKRRLMIARALVHKPKILILDEPTAGVDVELRHGMWKYLTKLNEEEGVTILLTTHYLEEVEQLCEEAAIIKQGQIIKQDKVSNLLRSLESEAYFIDVKPETLNKNIKLVGFDLKIVDDSTLEAVLQKNQVINDLVKELDKYNIAVQSIRPKGNRLEELFLNVLSDK